MALPAQLRKQTEAVDQLYKELNADQQGQGDSANATTGSNEDTGVAGQANGVTETAPMPQTTEQTSAGSTEETFEQKYRTLQGMYNAEVPRLHATNRELTNRVQQLEQLIGAMNAKPTQPQAPAPKHVTDQDIEDYGDSIEVMRKVFREEMTSKDSEIAEMRQLIRQMQGTVVPQVQQLSQNYAVANEQQFWATLQASVPDWQDINSSKEFQSWLLEVDPLTGIARQTYLDDAQRSLDARRVANFFVTWKGTTGAPDARTQRTAQSVAELERQVTPGRSRSGGSKPSGEPRTYSTDDIRAFFADVQRGKYRGKDEERARIERDIFAAQREGRIT